MRRFVEHQLNAMESPLTVSVAAAAAVSSGSSVPGTRGVFGRKSRDAAACSVVRERTAVSLVSGVKVHCTVVSEPERQSAVHALSPA